MGHIRLRRIPRRQEWNTVFGMLSSNDFSPSGLAQATAIAAHNRLSQLKKDPGFNYSFWLLTRLVSAASDKNFVTSLNNLGLELDQDSDALDFMREVKHVVECGITDRGRKSLFSEIGQLSLQTVLSTFVQEQANTLFGASINDVQSALRRLGSANHFGRVARVYFAHFMSRAIQSITDKEISNYVGQSTTLPHPKSVIEFNRGIEQYFQDASKIVESFAGGWFSKQEWQSLHDITESDAARFMAVALRKFQMELRGGAQ